MSSYSEGFELGYRASAPLAGISEGIRMFTEEYRKQEEIGRQRQQAFEQARKDFKSKMAQEYDKYVYEDQFDDTGFTDFDALGEKFRRGALELYQINEFAFRNGFISESDLISRNNNIKGQSEKLTKLYDDTNAMLQKKEELEAKGLGNKLNDIKLEILDNFSKNVKVTPGLDGLYMSTINKEGKQQNVSVTDFAKMLDADIGVDIQKDLNELLDLGGYMEYSTKDGKRLIRSFDRDDQRGRDLIKTKVEGYTDAQVIDAMFELDMATDDKKEAKEKGLILIGAENVFDTKVTDEMRQDLANRMQDELSKQQRWKMISKELPPPDLKEDKSLVSMSRILNKDAGDNRGDRIRFSPNKLQGLPMSYIQKYKGYHESINKTILEKDLVGYQVDATKDAQFLGANFFPDNGVFEVEIGYDAIKLDEKGNPVLDENFDEIIIPVKSTIILNTLSEINDFYAGIGRKDLMISSNDWEASRGMRIQSEEVGGTGSKYNQ